MKKIKFFILLSVSLILWINLSNALNIAGNTVYYNNNSVMGGVNVSVKVYQFSPGNPPHLVFLNSTLSNSSGFFNITINNSFESNSYLYKLTLIKYYSDNITAQYIGQSLPMFPYTTFAMLETTTTTFFLKEAATLEISTIGSQYEASYLTYYNNFTLPTYKSGLEIINWTDSTEKITYVNNSDCLIFMNSSYNINMSFCDLNITNPSDFEYKEGQGSYEFYFINKSLISLCVLSPTQSTLNCSTQYDISNRNYSTIGGIEFSDNENLFYIFAKNSTNDNVLDKYNSTLDINESIAMNIGIGKMEIYQGSLYIASNETDNYMLYRCSGNLAQCPNDPADKNWNFTSGIIITGIEWNPFDAKWYYASITTNSTTQFSFLTNSYKFRYQIKDTKLGYPVVENFDSSVYSSIMYVPANRNYSIMVYPEGGPAFPAKFDLVNITNGTYIQACGTTINEQNYINCTNLNLTTEFQNVYGYALYNDSTDIQNYTTFRVIAFLLESGNLVFKGASLPTNMGRWKQIPVNDTFNVTSGFYNITLPASALGADLMLFAIATINNSGNISYYGGFKTITLTLSSPPTSDYNFTLYPLIGEEHNFTIGMGNTENILITQKEFKVVSNNTNVNNAHIEVQLNYSSFAGSEVSFSWMLDIDENSNGTFYLPLFNYSIDKIQVFSPQYTPRKFKLSKEKLNNQQIIYLNLSRFEMKDPDGNEMPDLIVNMYKSGNECSIPSPSLPQCLPTGINLETNASEFNPFSLVVGGGKLDFEIKKRSNNITVRYINVDMLASGPPDALFDTSSNKTQSGNAIEEAWRFGSLGPEIYDYIIIGVPYNSSAINESDDIKINITKLYDENWNVIWEQGINDTTQLPYDYVDYNSEEYKSYINGSGVLCNLSDQNLSSGLCYKDTIEDMLWFKIPHFSGIAPTIQGSAIATTSSESENEGSGGSGGGSSSTSFWTNTYVVSNDSFNKGYTRELAKKQRVKIKIGKEYHYVGVVDINDTAATINVTSEPQQKVLSIGEEAKFEVTNDSYYDIYVKLNNITNNKANLTIKYIHEKIEEEKGGSKEKESKEEKSGEGEKEMEVKVSNRSLLIVVIIVVIIISILSVWWYKKRRYYHKGY